MKKKRFIILLAAAMALTVGCSDSDDPSSSSSKKSRRSESRTEKVTKAEDEDETEPRTGSDSELPSLIDEDNLTPGDEFFIENSSELLDVEDAADSDAAMTEADAAKLFKSRGFTDYPVTFDFDVKGNCVGDTEVSDSSKTRHPIYQTQYVSEAREVWTVMLVGNALIAEPISYNYECSDGPELIFAEENQLISYDDENNRFYYTVPKAELITLKVISEISSEELNKYTREELEDL